MNTILHGECGLVTFGNVAWPDTALFMFLLICTAFLCLLNEEDCVYDFPQN